MRSRSAVGVGEAVLLGNDLISIQNVSRVVKDQSFISLFSWSAMATGESSIFSSAPLGFYILGSMLMLVGAKYLAGWCSSPLLEILWMLMSLFVDHLPSVRSALTSKRPRLDWRDPKGIPGRPSWKVLENQDINARNFTIFPLFFFNLSICMCFLAVGHVILPIFNTLQ